MKHIRKTVITLALVPVLSAAALDIKLDKPVAPSDTIFAPDIIYSPIPKQYEIAGISVKGIPESDEYIAIGFSGLAIGDKVDIPGAEITDAVKRFWRQGLYSKVEINVDKVAGDKVWLVIELQRQPRMSEMRFEGTKGGEKKDITERLGMVSGQQLTPNIIAQAKHIIEDYYSKKGFKNAEIKIVQQPDLSKENQVILNVIVNRNSKVKVHKIYIDGNEVLSDRKIKRVMKKTNESSDLLKIFSQRKFVDRDFADDRTRIIDKYNELGYRDAKVTHDTLPRCPASIRATSTTRNTSTSAPRKTTTPSPTSISTTATSSSSSCPSRSGWRATASRCRCASSRARRPA